MQLSLKRIPFSLLVYWGLASMGFAMIGGIFGSTLPIFYDRDCYYQILKAPELQDFL